MAMKQVQIVVVLFAAPASLGRLVNRHETAPAIFALTRYASAALMEYKTEMKLTRTAAERHVERVVPGKLVT